MLCVAIVSLIVQSGLFNPAALISLKKCWIKEVAGLANHILVVLLQYSMLLISTLNMHIKGISKHKSKQKLITEAISS